MRKQKQLWNYLSKCRSDQVGQGALGSLQIPPSLDIAPQKETTEPKLFLRRLITLTPLHNRWCEVLCAEGLEIHILPINTALHVLERNYLGKAPSLIMRLAA